MSITMRTTRIRTPNNTYVVIPNREIIEDVLVNHSMYGETRVDVPLGIAYREDVDEARGVLLDAVGRVDGVSQLHLDRIGEPVWERAEGFPALSRAGGDS